MSDNLKTIDELAAEVNKKLGAGVLMRASAARQDVPHLSTGILAYDLAMGGGFAANQWNEIVGNESSGKTAIAYQTIAHNMKQDPEFLALWVAAEEYVPEYAASFDGMDIDRLWVVETNEMETALELVLKAVENRAVDMVVIDSIPALVPNDEADKSMEQAGMAVGARILGKFFRKCAKAQRRAEGEREVTLVAINQWRESIGVMFGDPRTTPGGKAKNYFYFTRMEVRRDDWIKDASAIEARVGQTIKMRVFKNKTYRPQQTGEVDFYFADSKAGFSLGDFDTSKDVVNVALSLDLFEGRYKFEGERIGKSKDDLYLAVSEDADLCERIKAEAMKILAKDVDTFRNFEMSEEDIDELVGEEVDSEEDA